MVDLVISSVLARWVPIQIVGLCASSTCRSMSKPEAFDYGSIHGPQMRTAAFLRHHLTLPHSSLDTLSKSSLMMTEKIAILPCKALTTKVKTKDTIPCHRDTHLCSAIKSRVKLANRQSTKYWASAASHPQRKSREAHTWLWLCC